MSLDSLALASEAVSSTGRKYLLDHSDVVSVRKPGEELPLHAFLFSYGEPVDSWLYPGYNGQPVKLSDRSMFWICFKMDGVKGYTPAELQRLFPKDFGKDGLPLDDREHDGPGEAHKVTLGGKEYHFPGLESEAEVKKIHLKEKLLLQKTWRLISDNDSYLLLPPSTIGKELLLVGDLKKLQEENQKLAAEIARKDEFIRTFKTISESRDEEFSQKKRKLEDSETELDQGKAKLETAEANFEHAQKKRNASLDDQIKLFIQAIIPGTKTARLKNSKLNSTPL